MENANFYAQPLDPRSPEESRECAFIAEAIRRFTLVDCKVTDFNTRPVPALQYRGGMAPDAYWSKWVWADFILDRSERISCGIAAFDPKSCTLIFLPRAAKHASGNVILTPHRRVIRVELGIIEAPHGLIRDIYCSTLN